MPPACPVDRYVPCYRDRCEAPSPACQGPARSLVSSSRLHSAMAAESRLNATGLPCESLRSLLLGIAAKHPPECHRLARWIVTFLATVAEHVTIPRASRGQSSREDDVAMKPSLDKSNSTVRPSMNESTRHASIDSTADYVQHLHDVGSRDYETVYCHCILPTAGSHDRRRMRPMTGHRVAECRACDRAAGGQRRGHWSTRIWVGRSCSIPTSRRTTVSKLEPSDTVDDWPGLSTVYLRIPWAYVEPEEGAFSGRSWTLRPAVAQGKRVAFRLTCSENWMPFATPEWVKKAARKRLLHLGQGTRSGGEALGSGLR